MLVLYVLNQSTGSVKLFPLRWDACKCWCSHTAYVFTQQEEPVVRFRSNIVRVDSAISISLFFLSYIFILYFFFPTSVISFSFRDSLPVCLVYLTRFSSLLTMTTAFLEWIEKTGSLIKEIVELHSLTYNNYLYINHYLLKVSIKHFRPSTQFMSS